MSLKLAQQIAQDACIKNPDIENIIKQLSKSTDDKAITRVISLFKKTLNQLEQDIWEGVPVEETIEQYQNTFKTLEKLYPLKSSDKRYAFKIVIPVADRPQHLKQCLNSLLTLCRNYEYGGIKNKQFCKVSVLIADDSRQKNNIESHKDYCTEFTNSGLKTEYFGLDEQLRLISNLSTADHSLASIVSDVKTIKDTAEFSHKGASIMRNITYLKLQHDFLKNTSTENTLIYFIDSDQEFCINSSQSDKKYYAINYFHYLNEIFNAQKITVLTGKVVGDPPVSPSVMAGNFQQDVQNFLNTIADMAPGSTCQFHQHQNDSKDDAAYHDMADLFGFSQQGRKFKYHCTLQDKHNNADCFNEFSKKLGHFFFGEHPTRKTFFNFDSGFSETVPARTVYTGNYVIKPEALTHFIPFATLKLRMAGPVLGRILKAEIPHQFVSANLPMLHNRTVLSMGQSEFRSGVDTKKENIDLGNEFIRQFYGDVMLFTVEQITDAGFPQKPLAKNTIQTVLNQTYQNIKTTYIEKHNTILELRSAIHQQLSDKKSWWNSPLENMSEIDSSLSNFNAFLDNIHSNFSEDSNAYQQITVSTNAKKYLDEILNAILSYNDDMKIWKKTLNT
ncbi:MAG: hypothetical protein ACC650_05340 [Gammaproteobacteria bacterium]